MILVDEHEPQGIYILCGQSEPVSWSALNRRGMADYAWACADGHVCQVERKQWSELLSSIDDVEEQLGREVRQAEELWLLVEGVCEPTAVGIDTYKKSENKPYFRMVHSHGSNGRPMPNMYSRVMGWMWGLDKAGVGVVQTSTQVGTAMWLVAAYHQSQKAEHTVLKRYVRARIQTQERDNRVLTLMGVKGVELGEVRAKALVERFSSIYHIVNADWEEIVAVKGFGRTMAVKLLRALGREDV